MAVTINAKGTSVPYFKIGKSGTTLFQGSTDPIARGYTVKTNDIWIDSSNETIKFRTATSTWNELASTISTLSDVNLSGLTDGDSIRYNGATSKWETDSSLVVTKTANTGAITLPMGTTSQRPGTSTTGMFRFNTDVDSFEGYNGASWVKLGHTAPAGDTRDMGSITDTSEVFTINYGYITDTDTSSYTQNRGLIIDDDEV